MHCRTGQSVVHLVCGCCQLNSGLWQRGKGVLGDASRGARLTPALKPLALLACLLLCLLCALLLRLALGGLPLLPLFGVQPLQVV